MKGYEKAGFVFEMRRSRVEFVGDVMLQACVLNEDVGEVASYML